MGHFSVRSNLRAHVIDGHAYLVDDRGMICEPGRFKNQPIYAPYFWNAYLDGTYDDEHWERGVHEIAFTITDDDRGDYPELAGATTLYMWEDRDGSLHMRLDRHE